MFKALQRIMLATMGPQKVSFEATQKQPQLILQADNISKP